MATNEMLLFLADINFFRKPHEKIFGIDLNFSRKKRNVIEMETEQCQTWFKS